MSNSTKTPKPAPVVTSSGRRPYRILSFDGGGIRGLIPAIWLSRLERELGGPIADHVDLVAGTSTGAILAAAVGLRIPMSEVVDLYRKRGREIFPGGAKRLWSRVSRLIGEGVSQPKYDAKGLSRALRETLRTAELEEPTFGYLSDSTGIKVMITSYDTISRTAFVMKSWDGRYNQLKLWEVVKASASAPTYFPAHVLEINGVERALIDGGVVANNPAVAAVATAVRVLGGVHEGIGGRDIVLGSFGTGELAREISKEDALEWGPLEWAIPVIDVLFDGSADAADYFLDTVMPSNRYFRFQTPLKVGYDDMDNPDQTNLNGLAAMAEFFLDTKVNGVTGAQRIEELANALKA